LSGGISEAMTGKGLSWTAAHLRAATSPDDVRTAIAEAKEQLGEGAIPAATVLAALEEVALEAARCRADLKNATRLREILLASVAHDLRNPLNTFAMSAGLIREDVEGPAFDRSRALSLLGRMDRASLRMQSLIEELLDASRVEAGTLELVQRAESATAIARAAIGKAAPQVTDKNATLEEGPIGDDALLNVDRARTVDALVKLVGVALRSTSEGGVIRLGVERGENANAVFTIRTTVSPRSVGSSPPRDESRGGLSLIVARGIITAQGGQLTTEMSPTGPRTLVSFPIRR
jgi:signal transduction histidine kinase